MNSNISNAVSLLQTQDGALKVAAKILDRVSELRTLNDDVTKSTSDKANYNTEFTALQSQLTAIASEICRSSAPTPGYAPGVSIRVTRGS